LIVDWLQFSIAPHQFEKPDRVANGADDAWEVGLVKFTIDMIERSSGGNLRDFRKRGLM